MPSDAFYDAGQLRQIATNLFYGWGYNFYRVENHLRADDQLVRARAADLLGIARGHVSTAELDYRREFLPPPSRQKPVPDPDAVAAARRLEKLGQDIDMLASLIRQQPVPENDRMTQRFRQEAPTLSRLIAMDEQMAGQCDLLRSIVTAQDGVAILQILPDIERGLTAIRTTMQQREALLSG